jgi:RNA polymerase sigma-54 factor
MPPDDSEWGGDAPARQQGAATDDDTDATEWVHTQESLTEHLHRQALALRLSDVDRAALRFLIESLNDDGYLEDPIETLAQGLAGADDPEQLDELVHHFTVALRLLQSLEPTGVGARNLAECLGLQLRALLQDGHGDPRPCRRPCASAASRWTCWRGATCAAWCSCAAAARNAPVPRWR